MTPSCSIRQTEPPYPYGYQLALWRCWGREDEAKKLLAALNTVQRGFGCPEYVMPEPLPKSAEPYSELKRTGTHGGYWL